MKTRIDPLISWLRDTDTVSADAIIRSEGTTLGYVRQVAYGNKTPSGEKASAIERATGVSRCVLRPDDWHLIWPELVEKNTAAS